ncbi:hypothetical protein COCNU_02G009370 [Cocos nucifera]|uniref:Uncharacterized protein n=1 Tax=Cocos nucifera TaxID=13894 RepID=A0A8K0HZE9_COCNU|nr:hypothetical protein COCNU_02G009370 [Cocos nucifera]
MAPSSSFRPNQRTVDRQPPAMPEHCQHWILVPPPSDHRCGSFDVRPIQNRTRPPVACLHGRQPTNLRPAIAIGSRRVHGRMFARHHRRLGSACHRWIWVLHRRIHAPRDGCPLHMCLHPRSTSRRRWFGRTATWMPPSESKPPLSCDFPAREEERDRISTIPSLDHGRPARERHWTARGTSFARLIGHKLVETHLQAPVHGR